MAGRGEIWVVLLRPHFDATDIYAERVLTLREALLAAATLDLRMRYNPDIKLFTIRVPEGAKREQIYEAIDHLTPAERRKAYNLPKHPMVGR